MNSDQAKALKIALESVFHSLNVPAHLVSNSDDVQLKRMIGSLASEVISKIDYEIMPYLYDRFKDLKTEPGSK